MIAIQGLLSGGKAFAPAIDAQTVQLIADLQRAMKLISGSVDDTLQELVTRLLAGGQHNSALLLLAEGHSAINMSGLLDFATADLSLPGDFELDASLARPNQRPLRPGDVQAGLCGHDTTRSPTPPPRPPLFRTESPAGGPRFLRRTHRDPRASAWRKRASAPARPARRCSVRVSIQDAEDALYNFKHMTVRERKRFFRFFEDVRDKVGDSTASSPPPRPTEAQYQSPRLQSRPEAQVSRLKPRSHNGAVWVRGRASVWKSAGVRRHPPDRPSSGSGKASARAAAGCRTAAGSPPRRPARGPVALERLAAAAAGVRARPVDRGGDEAEALEPEAVRAADGLAGPARPRLRLAALAVPRRAALAVGAGGRSAAALARCRRSRPCAPWPSRRSGRAGSRLTVAGARSSRCAICAIDQPCSRWCWASRTLRRRDASAAWKHWPKTCRSRLAL